MHEFMFLQLTHRHGGLIVRLYFNLTIVDRPSTPGASTTLSECRDQLIAIRQSPFNHHTPAIDSIGTVHLKDVETGCIERGEIDIEDIVTNAALALQGEQ